MKIFFNYYQQLSIRKICFDYFRKIHWLHSIIPIKKISFVRASINKYNNTSDQIYFYSFLLIQFFERSIIYIITNLCYQIIGFIFFRSVYFPRILSLLISQKFIGSKSITLEFPYRWSRLLSVTVSCNRKCKQERHRKLYIRG